MNQVIVSEQKITKTLTRSRLVWGSVFDIYAPSLGVRPLWAGLFFFHFEIRVYFVRCFVSGFLLFFKKRINPKRGLRRYVTNKTYLRREEMPT